MKKVIVTGAGGFIGRHSLVTLITKGFEVHAITTKDLPTEDNGCNWHKANLLDTTQIQKLVSKVKPTHLLHFAWYAVPGKYWTSEQNFLWVQASLELVRRFRECGGERVVMAGTCAEYDWEYGFCSEFVTPRNPNLPYSVCKQSLQEMLNSYSELVGLSSAWGRIFWLYGPHEYANRLVPSVICSLLKGEQARCSHGNQIRDFLYVLDVADGFVTLLDSDVQGCVNIASGKATTIKEIVYKIADIIGRRDLIQLGAIPTSSAEPPLVVADVTRLSNEVGCKPEYDLDKGITETINWWKSQIDLK